MWIETKDRLPKAWKSIPFIQRVNEKTIIRFGYVDDRGYWRQDHFQGRVIRNVIAWFDLPEYVPSTDQLIEELGY